MKTRSLRAHLLRAPVVAALALGLLATAPAFGQRYGDRGYRGGYDRGDRDDGSGRYDGYGRYGESDRNLARQLAREVRSLHRQAEQVNRRETAQPVVRMLNGLHRLDDSATRFERRPGEAEMADLLDAYDETSYACDGINPARYMREGMARIDSLVGQLARGYDRADGNDRYGRYGRGRRDDRGRYGDRYDRGW